MRIIILNGRKLKVSASEERVLRLLAGHTGRNERWAAKKSEFVEGRHVRWQHSILPQSRSRMAEIGVSEIFQQQLAKSKREERFFAAHPRCYSGIFGCPRRISAILNKIDLTSVAPDVSTSCL